MFHSRNSQVHLMIHLMRFHFCTTNFGMLQCGGIPIRGGRGEGPLICCLKGFIDPCHKPVLMIPNEGYDVL